MTLCLQQVVLLLEARDVLQSVNRAAVHLLHILEASVVPLERDVCDPHVLLLRPLLARHLVQTLHALQPRDLVLLHRLLLALQTLLPQRLVHRDHHLVRQRTTPHVPLLPPLVDRLAHLLHALVVAVRQVQHKHRRVQLRLHHERLLRLTASSHAHLELRLDLLLLRLHRDQVLQVPNHQLQHQLLVRVATELLQALLEQANHERYTSHTSGTSTLNVLHVARLSQHERRARRHCHDQRHRLDEGGQRRQQQALVAHHALHRLLHLPPRRTIIRIRVDHVRRQRPVRLALAEQRFDGVVQLLHLLLLHQRLRVLRQGSQHRRQRLRRVGKTLR